MSESGAKQGQQEKSASILGTQIAAVGAAFSFMTVVPVPVKLDLDPANIARSFAWYPLVGLFIGAVLVNAAGISPFSEAVTAALILVLGIVLTGALHIDGLADCADAWVGGIGDSRKTLTIMKDPACGPMAVAAVTCLLVLKYVLYREILQQQLALLLLLAPMLSRFSVLALMSSTTYVGQGFVAQALQSLHPRFLWFVQGSWIVLAFALFPINVVFAALLLVAIIVIVLRYYFIQRIGGFTGDCAGALIELSEVSVLLMGIGILQGIRG